MDTAQFVDLSLYWEELVKLAAERYYQKRGYRSAKLYAGDQGDLYGICGEKTIEVWTGLSMDTILRKEGDEGWDFKYEGITYDVKSNSIWPPDLREHIEKNGVKPKSKADYYILVYIVPERKSTRIIGWAKKEQFFGNMVCYPRRGWRWAVEYHRFSQWGQTGLPPRLQLLAERQWKNDNLH